MEDQKKEVSKDFFVLGVDKDMLAEAQSGQEMQIMLSLDDDNYSEIIENFQGALLLNCDAPSTYHGVYYWHEGAFPYVIKPQLKHVVFVYAGKAVSMSIKNIEPSVGTRFRFDHAQKRTMEDPNGDSCIWELTFTLQKDSENVQMTTPNTFLLRWNPTISSFKLKDYQKLTARFPEGFQLNWSIYQWEEAHEGDNFYMMRVGDDHAGLVFRGWFTSDPYPGNDWAGKGKTRYYADMDCVDCSAADSPRITLSQLKEAIPEIDWAAAIRACCSPSIKLRC